jgi:hypothetical protein
MQLLEVVYFASRCRTILPKTLHIMIEFLELQFCLSNGILLILDYLLELSHFMVKSCERSPLFLEFALCLLVLFL